MQAETDRLTNDSGIEFEASGRDEKFAGKSTALNGIGHELARICIASSADDGRRPEPGGNLDGRKDPGRSIFGADECPNLIGLKLRQFESVKHSVVESAGEFGRPVQPPCNGIPGDSHYPCNRRLVDSFHAERPQRGQKQRGSIEGPRMPCRRWSRTSGRKSCSGTGGADRSWYDRRSGE